jgi:hypothetical protein
MTLATKLVRIHSANCSVSRDREISSPMGATVVLMGKGFVNFYAGSAADLSVNGLGASFTTSVPLKRKSSWR